MLTTACFNSRVTLRLDVQPISGYAHIFVVSFVVIVPYPYVICCLAEWSVYNEVAAAVGIPPADVADDARSHAYGHHQKSASLPVASHSVINATS